MNGWVVVDVWMFGWLDSLDVGWMDGWMGGM